MVNFKGLSHGLLSNSTRSQRVQGTETGGGLLPFRSCSLQHDHSGLTGGKCGSASWLENYEDPRSTSEPKLKIEVEQNKSFSLMLSQPLSCSIIVPLDGYDEKNYSRCS